MVSVPIGNARRRGIRAPETMSTTDCVDAGNCTVARPAEPQLFNAAADRPLPLHGAERRQPRGLPSAGRADLARLPARAPRSTLPPAGPRGATESRVSLLFRKNSAPRRGVLPEQ